MWDGALLYLLIEVTDPDVAANRDSVEVYLDLWNDKFPKYEEDDGIIRIGKDGRLSGQGVYKDRLSAYTAAPGHNSEGLKIGYTVELALHIGGIPIKNGTPIGMEFGINDAEPPGDTRKHRIFWSSGNNRGLDSNTMWGIVVLDGYDGTSPMAVDDGSGHPYAKCPYQEIGGTDSRHLGG